jgi:aminoglycoside phosphotransferase (APT) family kinase protein
MTMPTEQLLASVAEAHRDAARSALAAAFGSNSVSGLERVRGGASGALTYRVEAGGRSYLLRIDTRRDALRNPHQYACMQTAAEAGIAPPLRHVDAEKQVAVMDFLAERPFAEYPGGQAALARDVGRLVARLQETPAFPEFYEYPAIVGRMLDFLSTSGVFAAGLLDLHVEGLARIREAYAWDRTATVSSHNDPNPRNIIFDGARLWLVDWEAAYRNDPLTDVAILVENLATTPELESALVEAWLGRAPDALVQARLRLMRLLTRVYYAGLLFTVAGGAARPAQVTDLDALTPAEFGVAVAQGKLRPASPEAMWALGKMCLAGFLAGLRAPGFEEALAVARAG